MIQIITTIESRMVLKFRYKEESTLRKADVYILGLNGAGEALIRAYEMPGGWKLFKVSQMDKLEITSTKCYGHKPGYKPTDKAFKKIIKKVS